MDKNEIVTKIVYSSILGASDHVCFMAEINCNVIMRDSETVKRNFYKGNNDDMREELSSVNWESMNSMNVEDSWNFFLSKLKASVEKMSR